jgi:hypothetical protein
MNDTPRVSVVIAAYEAGSVVGTALQSVLDQTMEDFEVLVIDDGSTKDPVPSDLSSDPRVRLVWKPENGGHPSVTNWGLDRARGEWMTWVDADDQIAPRFLEVMLGAGEAAGADIVIAPTAYVRDDHEVGVSPWDPPEGPISGAEALRRAIHGEFPLSQHLLYRRPITRADESLVYADYLFAREELSRAGTVAFTDEPYYRYVIHSGSVTGSLRESIFDLPALVDRVQPLLVRTFGEPDASELRIVHERHVVTHLLHAAARERTDSPLRRRVRAWCRSRMSVAGVRALLAEGHRSEAVSWALAMVSMRLHQEAYGAYDRVKDLRRR